MAIQKQSPMGLVEDKLGVQCGRQRRMGTRGAGVCTTGGWRGDQRQGGKVWIDIPPQQEGSWEACKLEIDRKVCALYTSLTAVREEWLGWDSGWCDSTPTLEDSPASPLRRDRSVAFESPLE